MVTTFVSSDYPYWGGKSKVELGQEVKVIMWTNDSLPVVMWTNDSLPVVYVSKHVSFLTDQLSDAPTPWSCRCDKDLPVERSHLQYTLNLKNGLYKEKGCGSINWERTRINPGLFSRLTPDQAEIIVRMRQPPKEITSTHLP